MLEYANWATSLANLGRLTVLNATGLTAAPSCSLTWSPRAVIMMQLSQLIFQLGHAAHRHVDGKTCNTPSTKSPCFYRKQLHCSNHCVFNGYVCKRTINIYEKNMSKSAKHMFNTRQQAWSTIIKQLEQQSSKQTIKPRQTNMVKHRQQSWSTLVKTHNRKSSKTCKGPRLLHAMHVNMHV
jgi:hypothetical protein